MRISEFMHAPVMRGATVEAGSEWLINDASWCLSERDVANSHDNFILPNVLLFFPRGLSFDHWPATRSQLARLHPAGLVVPQDCERFPDEAIVFCEQHRMAVLRTAGALDEHKFKAQFSDAAAQLLDEDERAQEWLRSLAYNEDVDTNEVTGSIHGYDPKHAYVTLMVRNQDASYQHSMDDERECEIARAILDARLSLPAAKTLSFMEGGWVTVFYVPVERDADRYQTENRIREAVADMREHTRVSWIVCLGKTASTLSDFHEALMSVVRTECVVIALDCAEDINCFDDYFMHILLLQEPKPELREHADYILEPLKDKPEFIDTLALYLLRGENLKETAAELGLHVHTLRYRLERISDLLGCDLRDPNTRFRLRMAITIERFLQSPYPDEFP